MKNEHRIRDNDYYNLEKIIMKENKATENLELENEQGQEVKDAYTKRKTTGKVMFRRREV